MVWGVLGWFGVFPRTRCNLSTCLFVKIFFIASVNKIMTNSYDFLLMS